MNERTLALLSVCLLLTACLARQAGDFQSNAVAPGDVWLRNITVISGERPMPLPNSHVVVRGDRILSVGSDPPSGNSADVTVIDGTGKYLVPGLIDGHVHLAQIPGMSPEQEAAMPELALAYYRQLPRSYLYYGFTAVVDLNAFDLNRITSIRSASVSPDVFDCGNALALANGYPMAGLPAPVRFKSFPNFLYDSRQVESIPSEYAAADHTPQAAVDRVQAMGGVCVKAYYETGFDPRLPALPVPTVGLMRQVREASHNHELPLLLHANSLEAHQFAAQVGVDAVVHGLWNWGSAGSGGVTGLPDPVRSVLDTEQQLGIAFMPTSRVVNGLADLFVPTFLDQPSLARILPAELIAWYRSEDAQWFKKEVLPGFENMTVDRIRTIFASNLDRPRQVTAYLAAQGGRIAFGSDTPSAPVYTNPPGFNGYLELRELQAAGLSPRQILIAATVENARLFRLEDYGTIEAGKLASLLVLSSDPMISTAAFDTIETVILKGRVIPRQILAAN